MISGTMIVNLEINEKPHFEEDSRISCKEIDCGFCYLMFRLNLEILTSCMKNTFLSLLITKYGEVVYA